MAIDETAVSSPAGGSPTNRAARAVIGDREEARHPPLVMTKLRGRARAFAAQRGLENRCEISAFHLFPDRRRIKLMSRDVPGNEPALAWVRGRRPSPPGRVKSYRCEDDALGAGRGRLVTQVA